MPVYLDTGGLVKTTTLPQIALAILTGIHCRTGTSNLSQPLLPPYYTFLLRGIRGSLSSLDSSVQREIFCRKVETLFSFIYFVSFVLNELMQTVAVIF